MKNSLIILGVLLPLGTTSSLVQASPSYEYCKDSFVVWTPESLNFKPQLPDTHRPGETCIRHTIFRAKHLNWMENIRLPENSQYLDIQNDSAVANDTLKIHGPINEVPGEPFKLASGRTLEAWHTHRGSTVLSVNMIDKLTVPNQLQWSIPAPNRLVTRYRLENGKHARNIELPANAKAFDTIVIYNMASTQTDVLGKNTAFPGQRMTVLPGDTVRAEFDPVTRHWSWVHAPYHKMEIGKWGWRLSSRALVELGDGHWRAVVRLPSGYDRDRIIVRSDATWDSSIQMDSYNPQENLPLRKGDEYELVYLAESKRWHVLRHPTKKVQFHDLNDGRMEDSDYPLTEVTVGTIRTPAKELTLPSPRAGARVLVGNSALWDITVAGSNLRVPVRPQEQIAFRVNDRGAWERETTTIDLVFVIDRSSGEVQSSWDALMIMRENLRLTNDALENSGAAFRYREAHVVYEGFSYRGVDLTHVATELHYDAKLQKLLKQLRADGIYYGGSNMWSWKGMCDAHFVSHRQKAFSIATALTCPTTTFRQRSAYALGMEIVENPKPVQVIGSGNQLPYYPTPHRMLPDGRFAFNPGQEQALEKMNANAEHVANFSEQL
ncbi:hypothetical protein [Stenotrophomonas maltophilia]|uniref:hypothetical protein n=1 Tax=Stenotrophomonas maltophilia TaxID=40324 RepID=UPI003D7DAD8D